LSRIRRAATRWISPSWPGTYLITWIWPARWACFNRLSSVNRMHWQAASSHRLQQTAASICKWASTS